MLHQRAVGFRSICMLVRLRLFLHCCACDCARLHDFARFACLRLPLDRVLVLFLLLLRLLNCRLLLLLLAHGGGLLLFGLLLRGCLSLSIRRCIIFCRLCYSTAHICRLRLLRRILQRLCSHGLRVPACAVDWLLLHAATLSGICPLLFDQGRVLLGLCGLLLRLRGLLLCLRLLFTGACIMWRWLLKLFNWLCWFCRVLPPYMLLRVGRVGPADGRATSVALGCVFYRWNDGLLAAAACVVAAGSVSCAKRQAITAC